MEEQKALASMEEVLDRMHASVVRSLCPGHFTNFHSFHNGFEKMKNQLHDILHDYGCMNYVWDLFEVFSPRPKEKIGKIHWENFESWWKYGSARNFFEGVFDQWSEEALKFIRTCPICKMCSNEKRRKEYEDWVNQTTCDTAGHQRRSIAQFNMQYRLEKEVLQKANEVKLEEWRDLFSEAEYYVCPSGLLLVDFTPDKVVDLNDIPPGSGGSRILL